MSAVGRQQDIAFDGALAVGDAAHTAGAIAQQLRRLELLDEPRAVALREEGQLGVEFGTCDHPGALFAGKDRSAPGGAGEAQAADAVGAGPQPLGYAELLNERKAARRECRAARFHARPRVAIEQDHIVLTAPRQSQRRGGAPRSSADDCNPCHGRALSTRALQIQAARDERGARQHAATSSIGAR